MSSAAASPVRTLASQERAQALKALARDYGASTPELLARFNPATSSWRTSQLCLDGDYHEFSEIWPRSGMMRNGIAYQLPPLVRLTDETESGLWPTPNAEGGTGYMSGSNRDTWRPTLNGAAQMAPTGNPPKITAEEFRGKGRKAAMWPTPTSRDWKDGSAQACANVRVNGKLGRAVFRTPQARDGMECGPSDPQRRMEQGHSVSLHDQIGGSLNPTWVEWLMGFPLGWTALEPLATPSSRKSRKSSGGRS
jgi:hypothetical protein